MFNNLAKSVFSSMDPTASAPYAHYEGRPVEYMEEVLGDVLTEQQKEAVRLSVTKNMVVMQSSTGVGKSYTMADLACYFFDVYQGMGVEIYLFAAPPSRNLQGILWKNIREAFHRHPSFDRKLIRSLKISRGSDVIEGVIIPTHGTSEEKVSKASGKHAPFLIFLIDEADAVPDEIFTGIDGCASGGEVRIVCSFNPKKRYGYVYNAIKSGRATLVKLCSFDHPNVIEGRTVIKGATTRGYVVDATNEWTVHVPEMDVKWDDDYPPYGYFKLPDFLVGTSSSTEIGKQYPPLRAGWRKVTDPQYSYKVLGEYPPSGDKQLFPQESIDAAVTRHSMIDWKKLSHLERTAGFDVADQGSDGCSLSLFKGYNVLERIIRWAGADVNEGTEIVLEHLVANQVTIVYGDAVGMGKMYMDLLREKVDQRGLGIQVVGVNVGKREKSRFLMRRDKLYWRLANWLKSSATCIPNDEELIRQLQAVSWEEGPNGRIVVTSKRQLRTLLSRSPDEMESALMRMDAGGSSYFSL